jgi:hypothetical protein
MALMDMMLKLLHLQNLLEPPISKKDLLPFYKSEKQTLQETNQRIKKPKTVIWGYKH